MSDSDLQDQLDSDSEPPHCNSEFHAHQENPRVLANWFFLTSDNLVYVFRDFIFISKLISAIKLLQSAAIPIIFSLL